MKIVKIQSNINFKRQEVSQPKPETASILNLQSNNAMVNFKRDLDRNSKIASNSDAAQSNIFKATLYKFYNTAKMILGKKD